MITWTEEVLLGFLVEVFQIHIQQLRDVKWHEVSARTGIPIEKCQRVWKELHGPRGRQAAWKNALWAAAKQPPLQDEHEGSESYSDGETASSDSYEIPPTKIATLSSTSPAPIRQNVEIERRQDMYEHGILSFRTYGHKEDNNKDQRDPRKRRKPLAAVRNNDKKQWSYVSPSPRSEIELNMGEKNHLPAKTTHSLQSTARRQINGTPTIASCHPIPPKVLSECNEIPIIPRRQFTENHGQMQRCPPRKFNPNFTKGESSGTNHLKRRIDDVTQKRNNSDLPSKVQFKPQKNNLLRQSQLPSAPEVIEMPSDIDPTTTRYINSEIKVPVLIFRELCNSLVKDINDLGIVQIDIDSKPTRNGSDVCHLGSVCGPRREVKNAKERLYRAKKKLIAKMEGKGKGRAKTEEIATGKSV
ncbi:hypothetical protein UCRPC4_g00618 [Phaeomoniella chlamydospora]|uniref:Uncharacterized protein n=1 Tax=Phaeomoniella chlamydospora TaxID=158046 RepID=A0A0G2F2B3_PHACM|nr:hypothetical protein UCRPC4_g00618 [Phaeomoniella chlamydospora]